MGMTMTQKILAAHAGLPEVKAGQLITAKLDFVLGNDVTSPVAINEFEKAGFDGIFDKKKVAMVMDHFAPNKDIKSAEHCKKCRVFAHKVGLENFYDGGEMGIEHIILPEKGLVAPGELIIGADSHTCTYGAINAFSTGVGSTDMAAGMAKGICWFKIPQAIKFNITGKFSKNVSGKDLILDIIKKIGVDGALYKSMEFMGDGIKNLTIDDRLCIANMAIEAGAKNGIFIFDEITKEFLKDKVTREYKTYAPDADAVYEQTFDIDLSTIRPTIAFPHLPENGKTIDEVRKMPEIKIDQVFIGACTNGRLSDLATAAQILKGKKVAPNVRVIIIPGSQKISLEAMEAGYVKTFIEAGAIFSTTTCGPCLGGHMGILAEGERCVATSNRNFVGRMGHVKSEIYLASPAVAASSALTGTLSLIGDDK
ncbi:MAG: 3-isopropylmalate dehydratase large subunit [Fusobacteriaceae bacterium]